MQILLVAATEMEIAPFVKNNPSADILITGVGIHATTYQLTRRIHQFDHDMIIQAGIAGSLQPRIEAGSVFAIRRDRFADIGIKENDQFFSLFAAGLAKDDMFPFKNEYLINETEYLQHCGLSICDAHTVNLVSDDISHSMAQAKKFHTSLETMEGAAFQYVCLQEEVPFLQIRSVSNIVGERDKSKWFLNGSIANLCSELQRIFDDLRQSHHA